MEIFLRGLADRSEQANIRAGADAGELAKRRLGFGRQTAELTDHKIDDVVGVALRVDAIEIPRPSRLCVIEDQQRLHPRAREKLNGEKRIAGGLLVHQLRERGRALRLAAQGVRDQLSQISSVSGASTISCTAAPRPADRIQLAHQRMRGIDFVVPIGADQEQMPNVRLRQKIFEQIERGGIEPLQIIEEERQRMLRASNDADEPPQDQLEAALRILRRKIGDRRLFADDEIPVRDELDDQQPIRTQGLAQRIAPVARVPLRSCSKSAGLDFERPAPASRKGCRAYTDRTCRRRKGRAAGPASLCSSLTTEDLPMPEYPETSTSSGMPRGDDPIERGKEGGDLARAAVQFLRDQEPSRHVVLAERKSSMRPLRLPFGEASPKIALDARGGLVALLGGLGEQLHDDGGNRRRDRLSTARAAAAAFWQCGSGPIPSDRAR